MKARINLKPCPFCGAIPHVEKGDDFETWGLYELVAEHSYPCPFIALVSSDLTEYSVEGIVESWNTR